MRAPSIDATPPRPRVTALAMFLLLAAARGYTEPPDSKLRKVGFDRVEGEYLVVLDDLVPPHAVAEQAAALAGSNRAKLQRSWRHAIKGFHIIASEADAEAIARHPMVKFVEENAAWYLSDAHATYVDPRTCESDTTPSCAAVVDNRLWHLDRLDQNTVDLDGSDYACDDASGVTVYVVDTGVNKYHSEFGPSGARVLTGYNATDDHMPADDPCLGFAELPQGEYDYIEETMYRSEVLSAGHGTGVASVLGGRYVGVAKNVTIVPVKVQRCDKYSSRARRASYDYDLNETTFRPNSSSVSVGMVYRAVQAGRTGSTPPPHNAWPLTPGERISDGSVVWEAVDTSGPAGTTADLVEGVNWILSSSNPGPKSFAVVTFSTYRVAGGSGNTATTESFESAVRSLLAANLTVVASANNQNGNACDTSPARLSANNPELAVANDVITAGGTMIINRPWGVDITDAEPGAVQADGGWEHVDPRPIGPEPPHDPSQPVREGRWICGLGDSSSCSSADPLYSPDPSSTSYVGYLGGSNAGPCVTLFAPAKNLTVASPASPTSYRDARLRGQLGSGTSFSAPIVAAAAARILERFSTLTPAELRTELLTQSASSMDTSSLNTYDAYGQQIVGTPNKLLQLSNVAILSQPASTGAHTGGTTLTVTASAPTPVTYQWYRVSSSFDLSASAGAAASEPIAGQTGNTFVAPNSVEPVGYWVRAIGECGTAASSIAVVVPAPPAPTGFSASRLPGGMVRLSWNSTDGSERYRVERKYTNTGWVTAGEVSATALTFDDLPSPPDGMVLYRVRALGGSAYLSMANLALSEPSAADWANTSADAYELITSTTPIKAQHVIDIRRAANALNLLAGLPSPFASDSLNIALVRQQNVRASDFVEAMSFINTARESATLNASSASFSIPPTPTGVIRASHILELRAATQ